MKHKFEYHHEGLSSYNSSLSLPETRVTMETDAVSLYDILRVFQDYLSACGFSFTSDEYITLTDIGDEEGKDEL